MVNEPPTPFVIHYGLLKDETMLVRSPFVIPNGFLTNYDSFLVWGENAELQEDDTLHLLTWSIHDPRPGREFVNHEFPYDVETDARRRLRDQIEFERNVLADAQPIGVRLIDYVVISSAKDWSERTAVWTLEGAIS